jgi:hypothetical protein
MFRLRSALNTTCFNRSPETSFESYPEESDELTLLASFSGRRRSKRQLRINRLPGNIFLGKSRSGDIGSWPLYSPFHVEGE